MPFILEIISRKDIRAYVRDALDAEGRALIERALASDGRIREICDQERLALANSGH